MHVWAWLCVIPAAAAMLLVRAPRADSAPDQQVAEMVGAILGLLLVGLLGASIAFYASRRSRTAASVTMVVLMGLVVAGQLGRAQQARRAARSGATQTVLDEVEHMRSEYGRMLKSEAGITTEASTELMDRLTTATDKASQELTGADAAAFKAVAKVLASMKEPMAQYDRALTAMLAHSPLAPGWMKTRSDIKVAREHVAAYRAANKALRQAGDLYITRFASEVNNSGLSAKQKAAMLSSFNAQSASISKWTTIIRDCDDELSDTCDEVCDLLEREWGQWRIEEEVLLFEDDAVLAEYSKLSGKVDEIAKRQTAAQAEVVKAMQNQPK
jgi:hypothetical protein